ncbi:MAG: MFS transporter [Gemmataceae bacterium]|nr:MFS transporter [Gemmataceae bacterium]
MVHQAAPTSHPSYVRFVILALTTAVAILLYLDRICLSFAERYIKEDLRLSDGDMAVVLSSFFWAYALAQVPSGWLSDRFGARLMLAVFLVGWSAVTGLLGLATSLLALLALRLGCGLFQAGAYPAAAGVVGNWIPFRRRGLASSIVSLGGRTGGALAPVLTAYLMVAFVPVSVSSLLGPEDVLDLQKLHNDLHSLSDDAKSQVARRIVAAIPPESASVMLRSLGPTRVPDPDELRLWVAGLNAALQHPLLLAALDLSKLDLPQEARRLVERDAAQLSIQEIQRRNRLVLETAFPQSIRKIYGLGWRPVMIVYGIAGVLFAVVFWWFFRDTPRQHHSCNPAELALIEGRPSPLPKGEGRAGGPTPLPEGEGNSGTRRERPPFPLVPILTSPSVWCISLVQFFTNIAWVFLITWFPRYLVDEYQVPVEERGWMTSVPILVGMVGMFAGGWWTDYMVHRFGLRWGRCLPLALTRLSMAAALALVLFLDTPWTVTFAFAYLALSTDLGTSSVWAYNLDVGGKYVGAILGWGNMFGNFGAALSPLLVQGLQRQLDWHGVFLVFAFMMVFASFLALFIDATKPIVRE